MANFRNITQVEEITAISEGDKLVINSGGKAKLYDAKEFLSDFVAGHDDTIKELEVLVSELENEKQDKLPSITVSDAGKFLRVNSNGNWYLVSISAAEGVSV